MNAKRYRKLWPIRERYHSFRRFGPERGGRRRPLLGLLQGTGPGGRRRGQRARREGRRVRAADALSRSRSGTSRSSSRASGSCSIVELSYTAQFYKYLRTFLDLPEGRTHVFKRSGGKDLTGGRGRREEIAEGARRRTRAGERWPYEHDVVDLPGLPAGRLQVGPEARLVRGLRRFRRARRRSTARWRSCSSSPGTRSSSPGSAAPRGCRATSRPSGSTASTAGR